MLTKGQVSLCGGSVIDLLSGWNPKGFDFFFHCGSVNLAEELLLKCMNYLTENCSDPIFKSTQAVETVEEPRRDTYQFIRRVYQTKEQVLLGFDLAPSRLGFNLKDGFFCTICSALALATKSFPIDTKFII